MAQSLGSIFVDLKANTTDFVAGMTKASYVAKQAGRDIQGVFTNLGDIAERSLAPLGGIGGEVGFALRQVGDAAGSTMRSVGAMGGTIGALTAVGAGAIAAMGTFGIAALGMAAHSAESTAKLYDQAQATGVSIEALTGLGYAAKQAGVSQDTLATGLERMSKSAYAAAAAPAGATNAYTRLGVAVKDSAGNFRSTTAIFEDLASRFAVMPDGVNKTALAIQLFGRSGAELIPLLNQGGDAIDRMVAKAQSLGIVIDGKTGEAAHRFTETLGDLSAAFGGLELELMKDLLPALETLASSFVSALAEPDSVLHVLITTVSTLTKVGVAAAYTFYAAFHEAFILIGDALHELLILGSTALQQLWDLSHLDFKGAEEVGARGLSEMKNVLERTLGDSKQVWKDYLAFTAGISGDSLVPKIPMPDEGLSPAAKQQWGATASGFTVGEDYLKYHRLPVPAPDDSAAQAQKKLETTLESVAAKYKEEAATAGMSAAKIQDYTLKVLGANAADLARIALLRYQAGQATLKVTAPASPIKADAPAIAGLDKLRDEYAGLSAAGEKWIQNLNAQRDAAIGVVDAGAPSQAPLFEGIGKSLEQDTSTKAKAVIDSLQDQVDSIGQSSLQVDLNKVGAAATPDETAQIRQLHDRVDLEEAMSRGLRAAGRGPETHDYSREISQLEELKRALQDYGESTLLVDAAIHDANERLNAQWDEAAFKVGTVTQKFQALADQIKLQGADPFEKMFQTLDSSFDDISSKLADFIVTGRNGFKEWGQQLAENVLKIQLQSSFAALVGLIPKPGEKGDVNSSTVKDLQATGLSALSSGPQQPASTTSTFTSTIERALGIKKPGNAPDGSSSHPFYVAFASGNGLAGPESQPSTITDLYSRLGRSITATTPPFLPFPSFDSTSNDLVANDLGSEGMSGLEEGPAAPSAPGHSIVTSIAKMFGPKATSTDTGPKGTPADPVYIAFAGQGAGGASGGGPFGGSQSNAGTFPSLLTSLFGNDADNAVDAQVGASGMSGLASGPPRPAGGNGFESLFSGLGGIGKDVGKAGSEIWGGLSTAGTAIGSGIASFFKMFAGFFAEGGDVSPGQFHMVGENGPEFFVPGQHGTIFPSASAFKNAPSSSSFGGFREAGGAVKPGMAYMVGEKRPEIFMPTPPPTSQSLTSSGRGSGGSTQVHLHLHGVNDADSFRRSESQIASSLHQQLERARSRNS